MQLTNVISIASFTAFTAAAPSTLETRQGSGGAYVAVGLKYRAGGCVDSNLIFADPIFGNGNVCQPLARQPDAEPIVSYKTVGTSPGCTGKFE